jgi:hypothetical protein
MKIKTIKEINEDIKKNCPDVIIGETIVIDISHIKFEEDEK